MSGPGSLLTRKPGMTEGPEPGAPGPGCCGAALRCSLRAVGVLLVLIPVCAYVRFSPVYSATECGHQVATVDNKGLLIGVTCWNPNPYLIQILTSRRGKAYVGEGTDRDKVEQIGDVEVMPGMRLPPGGSGHVHMRIDTQINSLLPFLEEEETPLYMELDFDVGVQIPLGPFGVYETTVPFKKSCGLNILMGRPGPLFCWDSFTLMVPPSLAPGADGKNDDDRPIRFTADLVNPKSIEKGEQLKRFAALCVGLPSCLLGLCLALGLASPSLPAAPGEADAEVALTAGGGGSPRNMSPLRSSAPAPFTDSLVDLFKFVSCGRRGISMDRLATPTSRDPSGSLTSRRLFTDESSPRKAPVDGDGYAFMLPGLPPGLRAAASAVQESPGSVAGWGL
jgi:hypothetical protein